MKRPAVVCLCLMLCFGGTGISATSAASASVSARTALISCLQQTYLMRDTYRLILAKYPTLESFQRVLLDEEAMLQTIKKVLVEREIDVPVDAGAVAAEILMKKIASDSQACCTAIELERSTAVRMANLLQATRNRDATSMAALIRNDSLGAHTRMFAAEKAAHRETPVSQTIPAASSSTRPFVAPVTSRTVTVPESLDTTGTHDVSAALNKFIASVPDGSVIAFPSGATYRLDEGIQFANRHNLIFAGYGATLRVGTGASGRNQLASSFVLGHAYGGYWAGGNTDIAIRDFVLVGNSPTPGVFRCGTEHLASFEVDGSKRVEIAGCHASGYYGDFVKIGNSTSVWVHDNTVPTVGRSGATIISGKDIVFERNSFGTVGYCVFNVEPNSASEATYNARFLENTAESWDCAFVSVEGSHTGATIDGITVTGNIVKNNSIRTVVDNGGKARIRNVLFTDNTGTKADDGPVLLFAHVDALTVANNIQPLSSGSLMRITDSTQR